MSYYHIIYNIFKWRKLFRYFKCALYTSYFNKFHLLSIMEINSKLISGIVTEYGQYPNTDTLDISETINPTNKCLMNKIFIIIQIV